MEGRIARRLAAVRAAALAHPRWRWMALMCVTGGMWLSVVNVTIANIALPDIASEFDADVASAGWVVTGFLIAQAIFLSLAGRAGDLYGRRRIFVAGVIVLSLASLAGAVAPSLPALVGSRVLMGIGASAMAPTAFAYAAELFDPRERGRTIGFMSGAMGVAPVIALNLGGVLVQETGWRSVFVFTPVMGVFVLAATALLLTESRPPIADRRFDLTGAALASSGLFAILLALSRGDAWGWRGPTTILVGVGGVALLAIFVWVEARSSSPLLELALFRRRSFATANVAAMAASAALFGTLLILPFFLTATLGFDPVRLGLAISPIALSFVIVAPVAGRVMERVGSNRLALAGFAVAAAGALGVAIGASAESYVAVLPGIAGLGVGLAMSSSAVTTTAIWGVPRAQLGVAVALPNVGRYTGGALGAAILGAMMAAALPAGVASAATGSDVATGFRGAMVVAALFLVVAAIAASRMPPVVGPTSPSIPRATAEPPVMR